MTSQHVTQEVIDAYYEYTHLTLDRRKFAIKLKEMAEAEAKPRPVFRDRVWTELGPEPETKLPQ